MSFVKKQDPLNRQCVAVFLHHHLCNNAVDEEPTGSVIFSILIFFFYIIEFIIASLMKKTVNLADKLWRVLRRCAGGQY